MKFNVIDIKGKVVDSVELEGSKAPSSHELYLVNKYIKAADYECTASAKTRGRVRGGGAKPFRQKGTGRARQGTSRSPLKVGGGVVFGPSPRSMAIQLNKKQIRKVIGQSLLAFDGKVQLVDFSNSDLLKTKDYDAFLSSNASSDSKVLFILNLDEANVWRCVRNHRTTHVSTVTSVDLFKMYQADRIYLSLPAFTELTKGEVR